ncbi:MAG: outer membrane beta-barrel protein [Saprospiraceae bacterium]|nr:outer membrane beta-barrel protein [Saprospiraceae bacterium]
MKQLYLLPLLLLSTVALFAQEKFELGFAVKAGTFTMPHEKKETIGLAYDYPAGFSSSYGVFVSRRLGGHFRLSLDLLYNFSRYEERGNGAEPFSSFLPATTKMTRNINAQSLITPLQILFSPKKNGKWVLNAGAALNVVLGSEMMTRMESDSQNPVTQWQSDPVRRFGEGTLLQAFLIAGLHYRMEQRTAIGLEFTGLLRREQLTYWNWSAPPMAIIACDCINPYNGIPFWMQSLAISLRHNILR